MLLLVVVNSVDDLDWRVASDKGQYVASCCREQRRRFGLASCKQRGQYVASCCREQHCRFGWRVASDEGQYVASCCREQRRQFGLASCKRRGTIRCFLLSRAASSIWIGELQATWDNTLLLVVMSSVTDLDWRVAGDERQYIASCYRRQRCCFG